jgi:hypothetical protein
METDACMTLQSQQVQIGDYLDIAVTLPNLAPSPSTSSSVYFSISFIK